MKREKGVQKKYHKLIVQVVNDYYGDSPHHKVIKSILGFNFDLSEEEKSDVWAIKQNMTDKTYMESF